ncbi:helix-turn-helix domain-containing protein [Streptomyces hygroscopicus]|uniref:helix-turn-helix domain-containing protein n=1 Tax=Streptomyces hygroscopicus TaxID=1912 RepID=UPI00223E9791|nr:helix-turn-helix domain-containing protein [Streptomyces hygroscopicus]
MGHTLDGQVQAAKTAIAARLRYIRQHHPEGPFTLARLAERAHVSKRTLAAAESAEGTNLTIETLVKVAHSLGIARWAYFLDEQVFQQVNTELEAVRALSRHKVQALAMRGSHPTSLSADQLSHLLNGIIDAAAQARDSLGGTAAAANEEEHHPDGNHRYSR